jgi:hypothetical protein
MAKRISDSDFSASALSWRKISYSDLDRGDR